MIATTAEDLPPDVRFDEIWSNPPIRIGKAELHALLATWQRREDRERPDAPTAPRYQATLP